VAYVGPNAIGYFTKCSESLSHTHIHKPNIELDHDEVHAPLHELIVSYVMKSSQAFTLSFSKAYFIAGA
jgi:hypothetical protein